MATSDYLVFITILEKGIKDMYSLKSFPKFNRIFDK
jgi:hypothetical protein